VDTIQARRASPFGPLSLVCSPVSCFGKQRLTGGVAARFVEALSSCQRSVPSTGV
jgi:hypothetical protein